MNEKPVIIVTGKVPNMQSWYEEKCKRALEELAHLADTIHRPGDTPQPWLGDQGGRNQNTPV